MTAIADQLVQRYSAFLTQHPGFVHVLCWVGVTSETGPLTVDRAIKLLGFEPDDVRELELFADPEAFFLDESNGAVSVFSLMDIENELLRLLSLDGEACAVSWDLDGTPWFRLAIGGYLVCHFQTLHSKSGRYPDALDAELAALGDALDGDDNWRAAMLALVQLRTGAQLQSAYLTSPRMGV